MDSPTIIYENSDYFVINKPAGYSVEPHLTYPSTTDWLDEQHSIKISNPESDRFGIVHRLDVETSGVLIWAKNPVAQADLLKTWQGRAVKKTYLALVVGETPKEGSVEQAIERDNRNDRQRVALLPGPKARPAITAYKQLAVGVYDDEKVSLVECHPVTGRTHQIRVHLQFLGHPILGDDLYGNKLSRLLAERMSIDRHWLHAYKIEIDDQNFTAPLPVDLLKSLEQTGIKPPVD